MPAVASSVTQQSTLTCCMWSAAVCNGSVSSVSQVFLDHTRVIRHLADAEVFLWVFAQPCTCTEVMDNLT